MKIEEIVVSRAQKVNIGNYQSSDVFVSLKSIVGPNENPDDVFAALIQKADEYLDIEVGMVKEKHDL
jgi:hypothetical protein